MHTIYGISLGPGDPELLTLKALRLLKEADLIFYPGTLTSGKKEKSFAGDILNALDNIHGTRRPILLPMKEIRDEAETIYSNAFNEIKKEVLTDKKVVIVAEGDASFFSTFGYLIPLLENNELPFEMVPGVPAFIAGGSMGKFPLVLGKQKLSVIPHLKSLDELKEHMENYETIVIMKLSKLADTIKEFIRQEKVKFYYAERIGTPLAFGTNNIEELMQRTIPYFSLLIISKNISQ